MTYLLFIVSFVLGLILFCVRHVRRDRLQKKAELDLLDRIHMEYLDHQLLDPRPVDLWNHRKSCQFCKRLQYGYQTWELFDPVLVSDATKELIEKEKAQHKIWAEKMTLYSKKVSRVNELLNEVQPWYPHLPDWIEVHQVQTYDAVIHRTYRVDTGHPKATIENMIGLIRSLKKGPFVTNTPNELRKMTNGDL